MEKSHANFWGYYIYLFVIPRFCVLLVLEINNKGGGGGDDYSVL